MRNGSSRFWRGIDQPDDVFFLFDVTDIAKARECISNPPAVEAAERSGVIDGEYRYIDASDGYHDS